MLRVIIIDDEEDGIDMLKLLALRNTGMMKVVASTVSPHEGITLIEDYQPDVVFLDISMPLMSGFELLEKLKFRAFKLIFTTAHAEYALQAIKNKAYDYLLKPIDYADFNKCISEIYRELYLSSAPEPSHKIAQEPIIDVQVKDGIIYIKQKNIIRLEASRSYTEIYLDNGQRHVASKTLRDFEAKLDPRIFYRCQKSHVINLQKVEKFINHQGFFALMSDGSMPDISKNKKEEFLERLKNA